MSEDRGDSWTVKVTEHEPLHVRVVKETAWRPIIFDLTTELMARFIGEVASPEILMRCEAILLEIQLEVGTITATAIENGEFCGGAAQLQLTGLESEFLCFESEGGEPSDEDMEHFIRGLHADLVEALKVAAKRFAGALSGLELAVFSEDEVIARFRVGPTGDSNDLSRR